MTTDLHPEVLYKAEEQEEVRPSQICANCGHDKSWHFVGRDGEMKCRFPHPKCLCKKFTLKNNSQELLPVQRGTDVLGKRLKPAGIPSDSDSKKSVKCSEGTQNQEMTEDVKKFVGNEYTQNHKKGCGKDVNCYGWPNKDGGWKCGQQYLNEEIILCPTCQEKGK